LGPAVDALAAALCLLMLTATAARAAHPFITDDTRTQGTGKFELELGSQYTRAPFDEGVVSNFQFAPQLTYGVTNELDAILRPTYNVNVLTGAQGARGSGFGDTNVEFKWRFFDGGRGASVALLAGSGFASGNAARGVDSGQTTPRAYLLVTAVADAFEVDCNIGTVRNVNDPKARQWLGHASMLALWTPYDDLRLGADFAVDQNPLRSTSQAPVVVLLGAIVKASPAWDLDAGYQRGLNHSAPRNQWLLGATLRW
jgi:outer membrane putative beta-barrel porin/alpha-amylase